MLLRITLEVQSCTNPAPVLPCSPPWHPHRWSGHRRVRRRNPTLSIVRSCSVFPVAGPHPCHVCGPGPSSCAGSRPGPLNHRFKSGAALWRQLTEGRAVNASEEMSMTSCLTARAVPCPPRPDSMRDVQFPPCPWLQFFEDLAPILVMSRNTLLFSWFKTVPTSTSADRSSISCDRSAFSPCTMRISMHLPVTASVFEARWLCSGPTGYRATSPGDGPPLAHCPLPMSGSRDGEPTVRASITGRYSSNGGTSAAITALNKSTTELGVPCAFVAPGALRSECRS